MITAHHPGEIVVQRRSIRQRLGWVLSRFAFVYVLLQLAVFLPIQFRRQDTERDVIAYFIVAERMRSEQPVYEPIPASGPHDPDYPYYLYPPFLAPALTLLPPLSFVNFARLWTVVLLASFWVYAASLARLAGRFTPVGILAAGAIIGLFPGAQKALSLGQVDPLLWALFGAALAWPAARGAGFAASAMVKLYCTWPLLFAVVRERTTVVLGAGGALLVGALVGILVMGPVSFLDAFRTWFTEVLPVMGQGSFNSDNVSISMAGLRLARLSGWEYSSGVLPAWARTYLSLTAIAGPLLVGWLTRSRPRELQYGAVGAAAILFSPVCWTSYLPILLAPAAILIRPLLRPANLRPRWS